VLLLLQGLLASRLALEHASVDLHGRVVDLFREVGQTLQTESGLVLFIALY
jgi:hypothetical protein